METEIKTESSVWTIPAATLAEAFKATLPCVSTDPNRTILHGVYLYAEKGVLEIVATDGRTLSAVTLPCGHEEKLSAIVPAPAVKMLLSPKGILGKAALKKIKGSLLEIKTDGKTVTFTHCQIMDNGDFCTYGDAFGPSSFSCEAVQGNFPNWKQVVPAFENGVTFGHWQSLVNAAADRETALKAAIENACAVHAQQMEGAGLTDQRKVELADFFRKNAKRTLKGMTDRQNSVHFVPSQDWPGAMSAGKLEISFTVNQMAFDFKLNQETPAGHAVHAFNPGYLERLGEICAAAEKAIGRPMLPTAQKNENEALTVYSDAVKHRLNMLSYHDQQIPAPAAFVLVMPQRFSR